MGGWGGFLSAHGSVSLLRGRVGMKEVTCLDINSPTDDEGSLLKHIIKQKCLKPEALALK